MLISLLFGCWIYFYEFACSFRGCWFVNYNVLSEKVSLALWNSLLLFCCDNPPSQKLNTYYHLVDKKKSVDFHYCNTYKVEFAFATFPYKSVRTSTGTLCLYVCAVLLSQILLKFYSPPCQEPGVPLKILIIKTKQEYFFCRHVNRKGDLSETPPPTAASLCLYSGYLFNKHVSEIFENDWLRNPCEKCFSFHKLRRTTIYLPSLVLS